MSQFRFGGFERIPNIVKNLIIINVLVFLLQNVVPGDFMEDTFALHYWQSPLFKPWQPLTHMFMHGSLGHIFFNMFALYMFGRILEDIWGPRRFLLFYIICGLGASMCHMAVLSYEYMPIYREIMANPSWKELPEYTLLTHQSTLGASGAVFGLLFAFGYLFPNEMLYLYFAVPIRAKWFVAGYALLELFSGVRNSAGDNVAHFAHLGGMLFAFILLRIWKQRVRNNFY